MTNDAELRALSAKLAAVQRTVHTLIAWIAQSAGSPLSQTDAEQLIRMLDEWKR